jgi:hypothetical protein
MLIQPKKVKDKVVIIIFGGNVIDIKDSFDEKASLKSALAFAEFGKVIVCNFEQVPNAPEKL